MISTMAHHDVNSRCAQAALAAPAWAATSRPDRAAALRAIAAGLERSADKIIDAADTETALGQPRLRSELTRTTYQLTMFADLLMDGTYLRTVIEHPDPDAPVAPRPDLRRTMIPVGPVAVFSASNFPLAFSVAGTDTAAALAAGCPVIVKAHPGHPTTSELVAEVVIRALLDSGAPEGTFAFVDGFDAGPALMTHPAIRAAAFTGSVRGGRALFDLAVNRPDPIPFYGELGSLNSLVVTAAAAAARGPEIAADLAASVLLGGGQFCTKPGLILLPSTAAGLRLRDDIADQFRRAAPVHMLTPQVLQGFENGCAALQLDPFVAVLALGRDTAGAATPVLFGAAADQLPDVALEECFGPTAVVADYSDDNELLAAAIRLPGALTATVHTEPEDYDLLARLVPALASKVGRLVFNQYPTGVAVSPAMHHGGPYPASTAAAYTSVGAAAIERFLRPVTFQNAPQGILPLELRD